MCFCFKFRKNNASEDIEPKIEFQLFYLKVFKLQITYLPLSQTSRHIRPDKVCS